MIALLVIAYIAALVSMAFPPALLVTIPALLLVSKTYKGRVRAVQSADLTARSKVYAAQQQADGREHDAAVRFFS